MKPFDCRACSKESRATWFRIDGGHTYLICEHCLTEHTLREAYGLPSALPVMPRWQICWRSSVGKREPHQPCSPGGSCVVFPCRLADTNGADGLRKARKRATLISAARSRFALARRVMIVRACDHQQYGQ